MAYCGSNDPLCYTIRFIDGLHADIRAIVLVPRHTSLDSACSVSLWQEAVAGPMRHKEPSIRTSFTMSRHLVDHFCFHLLHRGLIILKFHYLLKTSSLVIQARLLWTNSLLCAYRKAHGLCDKYVEKWHPGHWCASTGSLHALQELIEIFSLEDVVLPSTTPDVDSEHDCQLGLALSHGALLGIEGLKTMKFQGLGKSIGNTCGFWLFSHYFEPTHHFGFTWSVCSSQAIDSSSS